MASKPRKRRVRIEQPGTWVKYRPSLCRGCNAGCCTMPVVVTSEELFHMGFLEYGQVNGPLRRIGARLIREGIIAAYYDHNRTFRLKQHPNGDCVFLDGTRRCTIYAGRPNICRRFPYNGVRPGYCPSERKAKVTGRVELVLASSPLGSD